MNVRHFGIALSLGALAVSMACDTKNPTRPTVTFTAPLTQNPANGVQFNFNQQPITLQITNVVRTGSPTVIYKLEVATSDTFANPVFTKADIAEGAGSTSVTLNTLDGNTTYFWRWRAIIDGIEGQPSATQSFFVRPNVVISAPVLQAPANGAGIFAARPTFTTANAVRTGPAGTIFYEFQVSTSSAFASLIATATIQEQSGSTSFVPNADLPEGQIFWRVRASDPVAGAVSPFSNAGQFERRVGLDLATVSYIRGPNISTWPQTRTITEAYHVGDQLCTFFTGAFWPSTNFFGDPATQVEGNQFMFVNIGGTWYGGSGHWFRPGQACKGEVDAAFFVDAFVGNPPFDRLVLRTGDVFAVALTTPTRAYPDMKTLDQRSDVVFVVW